jgi:Ca-activated chloride channel family protein
MKNAAPTQHNRSRKQAGTTLLLTILLLTTYSAQAGTQLLLRRGDSPAVEQYTGVVDLVVDPGFDGARVTVTVDGQKVASGLASPYRVTVDFGPDPVQHRISVLATGPKGKRTQWTAMINRGMLPLSIRAKALDAVTGLFEVEATAPPHDPIEVVELWDNGKVIDAVNTPPYHFEVPPAVVERGFVQFTARSKSGEEVADFWSDAGQVLAHELQIRTVPIFVSVVDGNGNTKADVDRELFRILDNGTETKIIEFGKAFDQPISIALVLDASASMTYSMEHVTRAAADFVKHSLKEGDRCSVTAIQDVPRRRQPLTDDRTAIAAALTELAPRGNTALYDAVASAIRELRNEKRRRAIVVLSDGSDTASNWSFQDIEKEAREAGIPIYFIAYEGDDADEQRNIERLRYLAAQTGGFVAAATQQNLAAKYGEIEKDLRAQFAITYQVSDFGKANQWRDVRVVIASPTLTARTIKGYFVP